MRSYKIDYEEFSSAFNLEKQSEKAKESMNELIDRFNIKSKNVLSIAAGEAFEEFFFYKNKCKLTIIDIDYNGLIRKKLEKMQKKPDSDFRYIIDDVNNFNEYLNEKFNVIYISSFAPNELRNRTIHWYYNKPYIGRILNKIFKKIKIYEMLFSWPKTKKPFLEVIEKILDKCLDVGGLFIYQTYASGVISEDKIYINCIKKQLKSVSVKLLEIYSFKSYPNIHLIIGFKDNENNDFSINSIMNKNFKISKFHSRGIPIVNFKGIQKIYNFSENNDF